MIMQILKGYYLKIWWMNELLVSSVRNEKMNRAVSYTEN